MSYGFEMGFVQVKSYSEALKRANELAQMLIKDKNIEFMIEHNVYYLPYFRYSCQHSEDRKFQNLGIIASEYKAYNFFDIRFVYFKKAKLLGVCGACYPDEFKKEFKGFTYFQNSTDKDYDRNAWPKIKFFTSIFDECMALSLDFFKEKREHAYDYSEIVDEDDLNYIRKEEAYDRIFGTLSLDKWLYDENDDDTFVRFTISAITNQDQKFKIDNIVRKVCNYTL